MGWLDGKLSAVKKSASETISNASEAVAGIDIKDAASGLVDAATTAETAAAIKTKEASIDAHTAIKDKEKGDESIYRKIHLPPLRSQYEHLRIDLRLIARLNRKERVLELNS